MAAEDTAWSVEQWKAFLASVDSLAAAEADLQTVATFLHGFDSIKNAGHLDGVEAGELLAETGAPSAIGPKGLLRRAIRAAAQAADVKRRKTLAAVAAPAGSSQAIVAAQPGDGQSALALASAISASTARAVDVSAKLRAAHLQDL